ncbi:MAG: PEP-CTERM sorting domain-containing protein [Bryobacterales bacterium]|nr:PEP-CTERM sorting domain-containing protein [Bryobacterales bacterium]
MKLKWFVAVALTCVIPAFAGPILLNNTGMGGSVGGVDPNWLINGSAAAYVTTGSPNGFPFAFDGNPIWLANDSTSRWISPHATYTASGPGDTPGVWLFSTTFDLTGLDPNTATITGRWLADNSGGVIYLNGVNLGQGTTGWSSWTNFTITSGFQSGVNTLEFLVNNGPGAIGNPAGLRVEMSGNADPLGEIPEPATMLLMGAGLLGLGLIRRARKSAR